MTRTLFIHPTDPSTVFCELVYNQYRDRNDVTILTGSRVSHKIIKDALRSHDRIVFIGHGTEYGLLDMLGGFDRYVVTSKDLHYFRDKPVICYWCNANIFAEKYNLNAFATGMFISEIDEAIRYCLPAEQELIDASNTLFCNILSQHVFDDPEDIREIIYKEYRIENNPIVAFNRECMGFED